MLVLCRNANFTWGFLYLYDKMQLYGEIMQYYINKKSVSQVIEVARKYTKKDPNLVIFNYI